MLHLRSTPPNVSSYHNLCEFTQGADVQTRVTMEVFPGGSDWEGKREGSQRGVEDSSVRMLPHRVKDRGPV